MGMPVTAAEVPRYLAEVLKAGTPVNEIALNGDLTSATDQPIIFGRVCVDPGDDMTAATSLLSGAGCRVVMAGQWLQLDFAAGAKAIYLAAIGSGALPADYTGGVGVLSVAETDQTDALAQMIRLDISQVDAVKSLKIGLLTWNSGLTGRWFVEARSHA